MVKSVKTKRTFVFICGRRAEVKRKHQEVSTFSRCRPKHGKTVQS